MTDEIVQEYSDEAYRGLDRVSRTKTAFPLDPLDDRVIVRLVEEGERVTKGGIRLPKTTEVPQRGVIMAVGPGAIVEIAQSIVLPKELMDRWFMIPEPMRRPLRVKVGDVVYFARYAGVELKVDEENYLALRERDIIAIDRRPPRPATAPAAVDGEIP